MQVRLGEKLLFAGENKFNHFLHTKKSDISLFSTVKLLLVALSLDLDLYTLLPLLQYLLGIQRYIRFDRPPLQLLGTIAPASSSQDSSSALHDGAQCMSWRRSSSLPSSSQLWAKAI